MKNSTVTIEATSDGYSSKRRVVVDGREVPNVRSVKTSLSVDEAPVLTLELKPVQNIKIENALIAVDGVVMPESVEQALWEYLAAKYASATDVTMLRPKRGRVIDVTTLVTSNASGATVK